VEVRSDNGPQFVSHEFESYLKQCGIKHRKVTPYWPQANGQVERLNRVFLKSFRAARLEHVSLSDSLVQFLRMYRSTPHSSTKMSPAHVMFGREVRTKLPELNVKSEESVVKDAMTNDRNRKSDEKVYADSTRHVGSNDFKVGDKVFVKQSRQHKLMSRFGTQIYTVHKVMGNACVVMGKGGETIMRNFCYLKKCNPRAYDDFVEQNVDVDFCNSSDDDCDDFVTGANYNHTNERNVLAQATQRPRRNIRPPARFNDYVCWLKFKQKEGCSVVPV